MAEEWLVPFKGRNASGIYEQNFLGRDGAVYVMDNHRAALWCWLQHLHQGRVYNLIHIDEHTDALSSQLDTWLQLLPNVRSMTIDDYLAYSYTIDLRPNRLFRWDNYLSIFLSAYRRLVKSCVFATHGEGDAPNFPDCFELTPCDLPGYLESSISTEPEPWICNIDLDYLFYSSGEQSRARRFSGGFVARVFRAVKRHLEEDRLA